MHGVYVCLRYEFWTNHAHLFSFFHLCFCSIHYKFIIDIIFTSHSLPFLNNIFSLSLHHILVLLSLCKTNCRKKKKNACKPKIEAVAYRKEPEKREK